MKNLLGEKLKEELKTKTYRQLARELVVSSFILNSIVHNKPNHYREEILEYLYIMYKLKKDDWYYDHLSYNFSRPAIGDFFRKKREQLALGVETIARKLKTSTKQIYRIENGKIKDYKNNELVQKLLDFYNCKDWEKKLIRMSG